MKQGFIRIRDKDQSEALAWVEEGEIFNLKALVDSDLLDLICTRRINDPLFLKKIRSGLTNQRKYPFNFKELLEFPVSPRGPHLLLPYVPPEVWGVGVSYRHAAILHEENMKAEGLPTGLYSYVYESKRPEIFFKALGRHCIGHNVPFTIRADSKETMVEAELACILDSEGSIVAYTISNDVTAWDIEKETPLFLTYAKTFMGSCVLGPGIVPACLIPDPLALNVRCRISRHGERIYDGEGNTRRMKRSLNELRRYLCYCNRIADGTVLSTGTAVGIPNDLALQDGDEVTIWFDGLGMIRNKAKLWHSMDEEEVTF